MKSLRTILATLALSGGLAAAEEGPPAPPQPQPNALEQLERAVCDVVDRVRPAVCQVTVHRALTDVLQITTPVNPGDPGGALADARGEVVGIVASTYDRPFLDYEAVTKIYQDFLRLGEKFFGKNAQDTLRALRDAGGGRRGDE